VTDKKVPHGHVQISLALSEDELGGQVDHLGNHRSHDVTFNASNVL
jgi:hypothetical protein